MTLFLVREEKVGIIITRRKKEKRKKEKRKEKRKSRNGRRRKERKKAGEKKVMPWTAFIEKSSLRKFNVVVVQINTNARLNHIYVTLHLFKLGFYR